MKISKEKFEAQLKEDQELILEILAESPEVPVSKFFKVAGFLEYIHLFSGIIYSAIENSQNEEDKEV
jgi:hypothetical protein